MENNSEERRCIYVCGICNEKNEGKSTIYWLHSM